MTEALPGPHGDVPVRGVASGTYEHDRPEKTARYRLYTVEAGKLGADRVRVWDRVSRRFHDDDAARRLESRTNSTT
jgi:hypothetical protein